MMRCGRLLLAFIAFCAVALTALAMPVVAGSSVAIETALLTEPHAGATVQTVLPAGAEIILQGAPQNGFYPVQAGDLGGWVDGATLAGVKNPVAAESGAAPESTAPPAVPNTASDSLEPLDVAMVDASGASDTVADAAGIQPPAEVQPRGETLAQKGPVADTPTVPDPSSAAPPESAAPVASDGPVETTPPTEPESAAATSTVPLAEPAEPPAIAEPSDSADVADSADLTPLPVTEDGASAEPGEPVTTESASPPPVAVKGDNDATPETPLPDDVASPSPTPTRGDKSAPPPATATPEPTPAPRSATGPATAKWNAPLREWPGEDAPIVFSIPAGATVEQLGDVKQGHVYAMYMWMWGWVPLEALGPAAEAAAEEVPDDAEAEEVRTPRPGAGVARTTVDLSLRAGPSASEAAIVMVPAGTRVEQTGVMENGFQRVVWDGQIGWIANDYLEIPATPTPETANGRPNGKPEYSEREIIKIIESAADRYGQDRDAMLRVARCESGLDPYAVHPSGSYGLFQFIRSTWESTPYGNKDVFDPRANAMAASWMWSQGRQSEWVCK